MFTPEEIKLLQDHLDKHPAEVDWSYDGLGKDQISLLMEKGRDALQDDIWENSFDWTCQLEDDAIKYALDTVFPDRDFDFPDVLHDLHGEVDVTIDLDIERLIRQTTKCYISLGLKVEHDPHYEDYDDVADELEFWGINPKEMVDEWPDIPDRTPLLSTRDMWEAWINCFYYGEWHALMSGADVLKLLYNGEINGRAILKKGAPVTIYDYWNGAGSMIEYTGGGIEIDTAELYHDGKNRYGIQSCYGLIDSEWRGELEPIKEE